MSANCILVVDDEPQIRRVMRATLTANGYSVVEARNGQEALERLRDGEIALVLLDWNLPGISGLDTCRFLREASDVPIIMLTVHHTEKAKIQGLDAGADDYVTKPFSMPELLARVRAALRRAPLAALPAALDLGAVHIDFRGRNVAIAGRRGVHLTPKEFELLRCLAARPNQPIAHRELLQTVWGPDYGGEVEYLRVFINQLRKKLEPNPVEPQYLLTEPWVGYRLAVPGA